jgi:hypothetical protein
MAMPDFDTSDIRDDDQVEITDLDSQNDGFSSSLSLLLHNPGNKAGLLVILSTAMLH